MLTVMATTTPEELETMLEDAFLTWEYAVLSELFEKGAVVLARPDHRPARGIGAVTRRVVTTWEQGSTLSAVPGPLCGRGDTALDFGDETLAVMRRGGDRRWRYSICVFSPHLPCGEAWATERAGRR
jgi:hypothetical protein